MTMTRSIHIPFLFGDHLKCDLAEPGGNVLRRRLARCLIRSDNEFATTMKTILKMMFLSFLLSVSSSQCFALMSLKDISREQAKALGLVVRSHGAGQAGVKVWLELKSEGELKTFDRVELRIGAGEKPLVSAPLLATHASPGSVAVHFSADPAYLATSTFTIVVTNGLRDMVGYPLKVKDFVKLEKSP